MRTQVIERKSVAPTKRAVAVEDFGGDAPDPVVLLGRKHDALYRAARLCRTNEERDAAGAEWLKCVGLIAETPATSMPGVLVKLAIVRFDIDNGDTPYTDDIVDGVVADLQRISRSA